MIVDRIDLALAPNASDYIRLEARVARERGPRYCDIYWYDLPKQFADAIDRSANPWAVAMLPLAASCKESLRIDAPIDPLLKSGAEEVSRIFHCWYPDVRPVQIEAPLKQPRSPDPALSTAAFFSGGIDSWYTVLDRRPTKWITVHGFDIPLERAAAFLRMIDRFRPIAQRFGAELIPVVTNLRSSHWGRLPWGPLSHGCALASVAHVLSGLLNRAIIASSSNLRPWGSHVVTDPLLSATHLTIEHHAAAVSRVEKTRRIASSPAALTGLRVCWVGRDDLNCGRCEKCLRTMATLELLGVLDACSAFPRNPQSLTSLIRNLDLPDKYTVRFLDEVLALAREVHREDMVAAIQECKSRNMRHRRWQKRWSRVLGRFRIPAFVFI